MFPLHICGFRLAPKSSVAITRCFSLSWKGFGRGARGAQEIEPDEVQVFKKSPKFDHVWCSNDLDSSSRLLWQRYKKGDSEYDQYVANLLHRSRVMPKMLLVATGVYVTFIGVGACSLTQMAMGSLPALVPIACLLYIPFGMYVMMGMIRHNPPVLEVLFCKESGVITLATYTMGLKEQSNSLIHIPPNFRRFEMSSDYKKIIEGPMMSDDPPLFIDKMLRMTHRTPPFAGQLARQGGKDAVFLALDGIDLGSPFGELPPVLFFIKRNTLRQIYSCASGNSLFKESHFGNQLMKYASAVA